MKFTYIKNQYPTEEIYHLLLQPYGTDGFEEGLVISETTEDKSQYSEFYWWTK